MEKAISHLGAKQSTHYGGPAWQNRKDMQTEQLLVGVVWQTHTA